MTQKEAIEYLDNYRKLYADLAPEKFLEALNCILENTNTSIIWKPSIEQLNSFRVAKNVYEMKYTELNSPVDSKHSKTVEVLDSLDKDLTALIKA